MKTIKLALDTTPISTIRMLRGNISGTFFSSTFRNQIAMIVARANFPRDFRFRNIKGIISDL